MTFQVTILGSGSARPTTSRYHTAHVLNVHEQFFLIDCGEGTQYQLLRYGINPLKINVIFITHLHGDHVYGLFGLLSSMAMAGRERRLEIHAPKPFKAMLEDHFRYFGRMEHLGFDIDIREADTKKSEVVFENRVMEVVTVPLKHRVPCCGYLFREKQPKLNVKKERIGFYGLDPLQIVALKRGEDVTIKLPANGEERVVKCQEVTYRPYEPRSYAYCTDTMPLDSVGEIVSGANLLFHDTTFMEEDRQLAEETGHSTPREAAEVARKAEVGYLVTGHYSLRYKDLKPLWAEAEAVFERVIGGEDGLVIDIARDHTVTWKKKSGKSTEIM